MKTNLAYVDFKNHLQINKKQYLKRYFKENNSKNNSKANNLLVLIPISLTSIYLDNLNYTINTFKQNVNLMQTLFNSALLFNPFLNYKKPLENTFNNFNKYANVANDEQYFPQKKNLELVISN